MIAARRARRGDGTALATCQGLLVDWGGVLTTNVFASFEALLRATRGSTHDSCATASATTPRRASCCSTLETGALTEAEFERPLRERAGPAEDRAPGLIDRLFAG